MRLLKQIQREQFIIVKTRYDPVSQLSSQSHLFYVSGGKSIDKNISPSY